MLTLIFCFIEILLVYIIIFFYCIETILVEAVEFLLKEFVLLFVAYSIYQI